jgi:hypothetical protein
MRALEVLHFAKQRPVVFIDHHHAILSCDEEPVVGRIGSDVVPAATRILHPTMSARPSLLVCAAAIVAAAVRPAGQAEALFDFHSNPWMNLHHILWARGERAAPPADMTDADRSAWNEGIAFYARYAKRDLLFDEELIKIKVALRTVETTTSLNGVGIDAGVKATLERLMPIYTRYWWPAHDRTNREWIAAARKLLDQHGASLNAAIARAYGVTPENPVWVDVAVYAHPVGAYTTTSPTHVVISSTDPGYGGYAALEMLVHERSHAWGRMMADGVRAAATAQGVKTPSQLPHAITGADSQNRGSR